MTTEKLEVHRSTAGFWARRPAWLNVMAVICVVGMLLAMSMWTVYRAEYTLRTNVASKLETILQIETEAVRQWVRSKQQVVSFLASDVALAETMQRVQNNPEQAQLLLNEHLAVISERMNDAPCVLMTSNRRMVGSIGPKYLATRFSSLESQFCQTLMNDEPTFSPLLSLADDQVSKHPEAFVVVAPITHPKHGVVGFLGIGVDAETELSKVLASSHAGETGETLAVSMSGKLISASRFEQGRHGVFPNWSDENLGSRKSTKYVSVAGTPDQRGVNVAFASRWLPHIEIGLVTKVDIAEANAPIIQVRRFLWTLFGFLLVTTISTVFYRWYIYRLKQSAKRSDLDRKRLGPYELEGKVGEGGMGVVYRARHALLRRPTAIKILPPEKSSRTAIERFEREVQFTSQLKHPNTISIYDYGRTENGLFYYAMELLDGLNLEQLVRRQGPLSDGRVIHILQQVCESLAEAHSLGLVHRDIKPENIMICDRGGAFDTVKVLDFGMVRDRASGQLDSNDLVSGTPTYMAPECFKSPSKIDSRVDVFAVGAVGFYLLTGKPLLSVNDFNELLRLHETDIRIMAMRRLNKAQGDACSWRLRALVAQCVAANRDQRIESVDELFDMLDKCEPQITWDKAAANAWWKNAIDLDRTATELPTRTDVRNASDVPLAVTQAFNPINGDLNSEESSHRLVQC